MRLVSLTFLALCLPTAAAVYRMLPARARVGALLALDLAFYCLAAGSAALYTLARLRFISHLR